MTTLLGLVLVILATIGINEVFGRSFGANMFGIVVAIFIYTMLNWDF